MASLGNLTGGSSPPTFTSPEMENYRRMVEGGFALGSNFPGGFLGDSIFDQQQQSRTAFEVRERQQAARNEIELARLQCQTNPQLIYDCDAGKLEFAPNVYGPRTTPWQAFCRELRAEMADWLDVTLN